MKKFLLSIISVAMLFSVTGSVKATDENIDDKHEIIDAEGKTFEEMFGYPQESVQNGSLISPMGATDLYYQYIEGSLVWTGNRFATGTDNFGVTLYIGQAVVKALKFGLAATPFSTAINFTSVIINTVSGISTLNGKASKVTTYYSCYGNISFRVVDAIGNYVKTVTYTNMALAHSQDSKYIDSKGNVVVE